MTKRLLVLPGDGIGPEVTSEAMRVLDYVCDTADVSYEAEYARFGGASIDEYGKPATDETLRLATDSDAVFLGAVGGPKWDDVAHHLRPERGLLALRAELGVFANLRPARFFKALSAASPLKPELTEDVDFVVVRELIGGIYFGEPRGYAEGDSRGVNTMTYTPAEVRRVGKVAFELAQRRGGKLHSVDKANVLEVMRLWRAVITDLSADYPDVEVEHLYVDNCAMQLVTWPKQFDVIVTGNLFGDILSDAAAALTGSLGMLPSASLGEGAGMYEPVHGSAPDIAGKGVANPLAAILSMGMLLESSFGRPDLGNAVSAAVDGALADGLRTRDLARTSTDGIELVGTTAMTDAVLAHLRAALEEGAEEAE